ncbi:hypothetical protein QUF44_00025 [Bacillus subtilis]|nr:hypothetical protein [Bacillus subtilis]MDM5300063.1 hypothetical protein [Bacillus subtilis]MDM5322116.1 hypothetical protein [Bacillus subtilis]
MKQIQYHDWGQCYFYLVSLLKERGEAIPNDLKDWSTKAIVKEIKKYEIALQGRGL